MSNKKGNAVIVILAAGARVFDPINAPDKPKLLEKIGGKPVLHYVVQTALGVRAANIVDIVIVVSERFSDVLTRSLAGFPVHIAIQHGHRGTADAVRSVIKGGLYPSNEEADYLVVLMGDQPLVTSTDIDRLIESFEEASPKSAGIMTFRQDRRKDEFKKCGVVIMEKRQFKDLQSGIPIPRNTKTELLHAGPYIFNSVWLRSILSAQGRYQDKLPADGSEHHLYGALLDALEYYGVHLYRSKYSADYLGGDTPLAFPILEKRLKRRRQYKTK